MAANAYIGTSGWSYDAWKNDFYEGVPKKRWLEYCAEKFTSVEANGTFYRLQSEKTLENWRQSTPAEFRFAIKGHRYVTHNKSLKDADDTIPRSRDNAQSLGRKLAAVVWQLPRQFHKNLDRLANFAHVLSSRWPSVGHSLEFRHSSWFADDVADCMRAHNLAVCMSDAADWPLWEEVTADFVYVRFHGHSRTYQSKYSEQLLGEWAERMRGWLGEGKDVYAYFDNDAEGAAPWDALRLRRLVGA